MKPASTISGSLPKRAESGIEDFTLCGSISRTISSTRDRSESDRMEFERLAQADHRSESCSDIVKIDPGFHIEKWRIVSRFALSSSSVSQKRNLILWSSGGWLCCGFCRIKNRSSISSWLILSCGQNHSQLRIMGGNLGDGVHWQTHRQVAWNDRDACRALSKVCVEPLHYSAGNQFNSAEEALEPPEERELKIDLNSCLP